MTEPTVEERLREWTEHNDPMLSYHPLMCDALAKLREQAEEIERLGQIVVSLTTELEPMTTPDRAALREAIEVALDAIGMLCYCDPNELRDMGDTDKAAVTLRAWLASGLNADERATVRWVVAEMGSGVVRNGRRVLYVPGNVVEQWANALRIIGCS